MRSQYGASPSTVKGDEQTRLSSLYLGRMRSDCVVPDGRDSHLPLAGREHDTREPVAVLIDAPR